MRNSSSKITTVASLHQANKRQLITWSHDRTQVSLRACAGMYRYRSLGSLGGLLNRGTYAAQFDVMQIKQQDTVCAVRLVLSVTSRGTIVYSDNRFQWCMRYKLACVIML